jgi:hypothetical protein
MYLLLFLYLSLCPSRLPLQLRNNKLNEENTSKSAYADFGL